MLRLHNAATGITLLVSEPEPAELDSYSEQAQFEGRFMQSKPGDASPLCSTWSGYSSAFRLRILARGVAYGLRILGHVRGAQRQVAGVVPQSSALPSPRVRKPGRSMSPNRRSVVGRFGAAMRRSMKQGALFGGQVIHISCSAAICCDTRTRF